MKIKKILSLLLSVVMILSLAPVASFANDANAITAYVNVSKYGEVLNDKANNAMAYIPIELSGKESYNLNDVFTELHNICYEGGSEEGYACANGDYGLFITKFWNDESGYFGYQVNGGTENVSGLSYEVKNGDYIDAVIYQSAYPDTEGYAKFDKTTVDATEGDTFEITLFYVSGYDENYNMIFSPCEDATITIDGQQSEYVTDENGKVSITLNDSGKHIISAKKSKIVGDNMVTAITAPVCVANVSQVSAVSIVHNIAKKYIQSDLTTSGGILPWIVADLMVYEKLYPNSENKLTDTQKQVYLDKIIADVKDATSPGDMAKSIIALRSMGFDARNVYTSSLEKIDVVSRLAELIEDASVANNEYTLPYVMIALSQSSDYITQQQTTYLVNCALSLSDRWQSVTYGTDALTPMLLALAPYYDGNANVKEAVDNAVNILKEQQRSDGMIDGWPGSEGASTGLAICGLSSLSVNADQIKNTGNSLIDGLLTDVNESYDGFSNAFSTEQGFRGLLSWLLFTDGDGRDMYDFSDYTSNKAYATWANGCPVTFELIPSDATVNVEGAEAVSENMFDLTEGTYSYSVSKSGYNTKTGEIVVTNEDEQNHIPQKINVSLSENTSGSGSASTNISITVKVMVHDESECNGSYTYKNNSSKYTALVNETITAKKGTSVFSVLDEVLNKNNIGYVEGSEGYISSINGLSELDHGKNSGWMFTIDGKHITTGCREAKLNSSSTLVWFYTDDYTNEKGSEEYRGYGGSGTTVNQENVMIDSANVSIKPNVTVDKNGIASVIVKAETISSAINIAAKDKTVSAVDVAPEIKGDATKISVEIPKMAVGNIANDSSLDITLTSDIAKVTILNKGLKQLDGNLCLTVENKDNGVDVEITVDGNVKNNIDGGVNITIPSSGANENTVLVIVNQDGSEKIVKKSALTTDGIKAIINGSAAIKFADKINDYSDTEGHWGKSAVDFVTSREIFAGTDKGFEPDTNTSRAMLVTTLFRLEDAKADGTHSFEDVSDDTWYTDAVVWASTNNIAEGTEKGFEPDGNVTREQLCAIIYRYANYVGINTDSNGNFDNFKDKDNASKWARDAIAWTVNNGIVSGKPGQLLDPQGFATRAEVAVIYQRMIQLMVD